MTNGVFNDSVLLARASKYINTPLSLMYDDIAGGISLDPESELNKALIEITDGLLKHLVSNPFPFVFHAEIFVDSTGNFTFCEVGSRAGGGRSL